MPKEGNQLYLSTQIRGVAARIYGNSAKVWTALERIPRAFESCDGLFELLPEYGWILPALEFPLEVIGGIARASLLYLIRLIEPVWLSFKLWLESILEVGCWLEI